MRQERATASEGWLLVGLIVLITAVILALAGTTFYLTEHLRTTSLRQNQTRAIYLAQAGVMWELREYRRGQEISTGEQTVTAGPLPGTADDDVFNIAGPAADFLLVNMRETVNFANTFYCPASGPGRVSRQRIRNWTVRNVLASDSAVSSLTVDAMRIDWSPDGGEGILRIDLNGTAPTWQAPGCVAAGRDTPIDIDPDRTLTAGQRWNNNQIWFTATSGMDAKEWIDVTFILSDATERRSRYVPANPDQSWAEFTLRSVGEVRLGAFPFSVWRRLRAEYRVCAQPGDIGANCTDAGDEQSNIGAIIAYEELNNLTP